jgi:hypothetical protein
MTKLVCDRCGFELTDKQAIYLALEGTEAWQNAQRSRGFEPRGIFPCRNFSQCKGEMLLVKEANSKKNQSGRGK